MSVLGSGYSYRLWFPCRPRLRFSGCLTVSSAVVVSCFGYGLGSFWVSLKVSVGVGFVFGFSLVSENVHGYGRYWVYRFSSVPFQVVYFSFFDVGFGCGYGFIDCGLLRFQMRFCLGFRFRFPILVQFRFRLRLRFGLRLRFRCQFRLWSCFRFGIECGFGCGIGLGFRFGLKIGYNLNFGFALSATGYGHGRGFRFGFGFGFGVGFGYVLCLGLCLGSGYGFIHRFGYVVGYGFGQKTLVTV